MAVSELKMFFSEIFLTFVRGTITSAKYIDMLKHEFIPYLKECEELGDAFLMQDGATPHTANKTLQFLHKIFKNRVISGKFKDLFNCGYSWPPYSPDLNPCDFFLWGYLKQRVYSRQPSTIEDMEEMIAQEVEAMTEELLTRVIRSFERRLKSVIDAKGCHFEGIEKFQ